VLLRRVTELSPDEHARLLVANLRTVQRQTSDAVPSFPSDRTTCEFATFRWADAHRA
jgi:hypothetical protein